jgi:opacity protein-like surface antigen
MKPKVFWPVWSLCILCMVMCAVEDRDASAEWYVAGQFGVNFADRLTNINGTNGFAGSTAPDFDLKNSFTYGGKVGYFPGNSWLGVEVDAFHTTPHIKNLDDIPGIHLRVTSAGVNLIARYPGVTFQPYAGIGAAAVFAHISDSSTTRSDSNVTGGLNVLAGIRAFVTPYVAIFTEYKLTQATLRFDQAFSGFGTAGGFTGDYRAQQLLVGVSYHF